MVTNSLHKMREALESIRNLAFEVQDMNGEGDVKTSLPPRWVIDVVNFALSEPPRQCDVGTADEQEERFKQFCASNYSACDVDMECCRCPLESEKASCEFAWAQTPYEAQEGAGE